MEFEDMSPFLYNESKTLEFSGPFFSLHWICIDGYKYRLKNKEAGLLKVWHCGPMAILPRCLCRAQAGRKSGRENVGPWPSNFSQNCSGVEMRTTSQVLAHKVPFCIALYALMQMKTWTKIALWCQGQFNSTYLNTVSYLCCLLWHLFTLPTKMS